MHSPVREWNWMRQFDSLPTLDPTSLRTGGSVKFVSDIYAVAELKTLAIARSWYWFLLAALVFPLPIFYVTQSLTSDSPEAIRRIMAGTFVYGAAFTTGVFVGQGFAAERFSGTLKLLVTMPVSKMAYVFGSLLHSSLMGTATVIALLAFALIAGVDMRLTWAFLPAIALTVLCLTGLTLFTISFAPSLPVANIMAGFLGVVLTLISPVYFTMDQAPLLLRWLGYVSPLRYAADAITESLSGSTDIWIELAVLSLFALGAMSVGLWKLPWRER